MLRQEIDALKAGVAFLRDRSPCEEGEIFEVKEKVKEELAKAMAETVEIKTKAMEDSIEGKMDAKEEAWVEVVRKTSGKKSKRMLKRVHFRGFPSELLPYEGEDAMKWSFINSLKEASYVVYGSTKHVMNLSQTEQSDLWRSVVQGDMESYNRVCLRLAPPPGANSSAVRGPGDPEATTNKRQTEEETKALKVPFRLYIRTVEVNDRVFAKGFPLKSWDDITYISRPVDVLTEDGAVLTLWEALHKIAPQLFACVSELPNRDQTLPAPLLWESESATNTSKFDYSMYPFIRPIATHMWGHKAHFVNGVIRIQGIEPSPDLPVDWIARNLCGPDHFVHTCILIAINEK
ncbi:hypothetical protein L7F22_026495 [Adiantum nelumboides]|nr:hypothetical protein [Adiantum nelumboides]